MTVQAYGLDKDPATLSEWRREGTDLAALITRIVKPAQPFSCYLVTTDEGRLLYNLTHPVKSVMKAALNALSKVVWTYKPTTLTGFINLSNHSVKSHYQGYGDSPDNPICVVNSNEVSFHKSVVSEVKAYLEETLTPPTLNAEAKREVEKYDGNFIVELCKKAFTRSVDVECSQPYWGKLGTGVFELYSEKPLFGKIVEILKGLGLKVGGWDCTEPLDVKVGIKDRAPILYDHLIFRTAFAFRKFQDCLLAKIAADEMIPLELSTTPFQATVLQPPSSQHKLSPASAPTNNLDKSHMDALVLAIPSLRGLLTEAIKEDSSTRVYIAKDPPSRDLAFRRIKEELEARRTKDLAGVHPDNPNHSFQQLIREQSGNPLGIEISFRAVQSLDSLINSEKRC